MERTTVRDNEHEFVTDDDPNFDRKLDLVTAGAHPYVKQHLLTRITKQNCLLIINYILAFTTEVNPSPTYRINTINKLKRLAEHYFITTAATVIFTLAMTASSMGAPVATATETDSNTTTATSSFSDIELSPQPVYKEHVRDVSETLINQTHAHLIVEGNGTLTLPNSTESIRTTSTGSGIVSIIGTFVGKEILTTQDGSENATARSYEIAWSNKEEGIGKGIAIAIIHTNSTGRLAPLDGMILVGQEEIQPDGSGMITLWEWQSGIPLPTPITTISPLQEPPLMNTTATDTIDTNATSATDEQQ